MNQSNRNTSSLDYSTQLAVSRTRLAADRTLMSWIRTSISLISFGFALIKFFEYLKFLGTSNIKIPTTGITHLGISLIFLGLISLIPAMIEYQKEIRALREIDKTIRKSYITIVGYCVALIGLYALGNVLKLVFS